MTQEKHGRIPDDRLFINTDGELRFKRKVALLMKETGTHKWSACFQITNNTGGGYSDWMKRL